MKIIGESKSSPAAITSIKKNKWKESIDQILYIAITFVSIFILFLCLSLVIFFLLRNGWSLFYGERESNVWIKSA